MKKFYSMLAILLILASLLSVLVSCKQNVTPVDEEEETTTEAPSEGNKSYPMTEKDKENIYKTAMHYLSIGVADSAYSEFKKIPTYKNVPEYLARFSFQPSNAYEFSPDEVDHVNKFGYGFNTYGQPTKVTQRGEKSKDTVWVYDEKSRPTMKTDSPYVYHYAYDDATNLLIETTMQYGTELHTTVHKYEYAADPKRITSEFTTVTSSSIPGKILKTVEVLYEYNAKGDITKETATTTVPNDDPAILPEVTVDVSIYEYNKAGLLVKFSGVDILGNYTIEYEYKNGLLVKETLKHEDEAPTITNENYEKYTNFVYEQTITYTYDEKDCVAGKVVVSKIFEEPPKGAITANTPKLLFNDKTRTWQYTKYDIYYNPYA